MSRDGGRPKKKAPARRVGGGELGPLHSGFALGRLGQMLWSRSLITLDRPEWSRALPRLTP